MKNKVYIYESPDKGKTIFRREFGKTERQIRRPIYADQGKPNPCHEITLAGLKYEWVPENKLAA